MNKLLPCLLMLFCAGVVFSQEQVPVLDSSYGVKTFSDADGISPYSIRQSPDGGLYAGGDYGLLRFDANGNKLWSVVYPTVKPDYVTSAAGAIAVDPAGNVYICVDEFINYVPEPHLLKYSPQGALVKDYRLLSAVSAADEPYAYGAAYNAGSQKVYAALGYYSEADNSLVTDIEELDKDLNVIKDAVHPGPGTDDTPLAGIGIDASSNVYTGGSRTGSLIYALKYDADLNLKYDFSKDPVAPKMFVSGEVIPGGGVYITDNESGGTGLHNISASGAENWGNVLDYSTDIYIHSVDKAGNFYAVENLQTPQFSEVGYTDGAVKWTVPEQQSVLLNAIFVDDQGRIYTEGYLAAPDGDNDSYIARYTQKAAKYSIAKSTGDNQIVAVSSYTAPLAGLVNVSGTTTPANGIGVNFTISTFPAGAVGQELTKSSETTDANGLADVTLKLGNIPAEYGITATCPACEASASTVTFTCCGKLKNDHFSQSHEPNWSYAPYARHTSTETYGTIGYLGCGVTALATLSNYYAANISTSIPTTNPGILNTYLREMPGVTGYNASNDVQFSAIGIFSSSTVRYIRDESASVWEEGITRQILIDRTNREILAGRPVIFQIRRLRSDGTFGPHFIVAVGKCGNNYIISDPIGGEERLYNPTEPNTRLIGIRVFRP